MGEWEALLAGPRGDFPRGPAPNQALPLRPWIIALLLAACLVPRAVAAWNWDVLWGDSLSYRCASIALEQGDFEQAFAEFGLNIYPLILIPLRHLGIDWEIAGKCFGVLVASCTVLPLWGWLRRMFDDRLAVIACLVYALQGKLIAVSPLIIRDSTFWFLLVLTLYYVWRAVGELRIGFFLAAGVALTLAVHTRTEGWLLLIPLLGWGACRWFGACPGTTCGAGVSPAPAAGTATAQKRLRLAVGTVLCIAVIPAAVSVVNFTWLREHPRWEFLRTAHLHMAIDWLNSVSGLHLPLPREENVMPAQGPVLEASPPPLAATSPAAKPVAKTPPPFPSILVPAVVAPEQTTPSWILTFKLLERLAKGYTWMGSFLLLIGLACGLRVFLRPEHLTLFLMNLLLLVISRIRYWTAGLDLRYFMPMVIISVPWMALGLEYIIAAARWLLQRRGECSPRALRLFAGSLIAVAVACSLLDGPMSAAAYMRKHAALGLWILNRAGPEAAIAGNIDYVTLDTYYAKGRVVGIFWPRNCLIVPMPAALTERKADVVVLWNEENIDKTHFASIEERIAYCGYRRVDQKQLPAGPDELMVFVRE